MNEENVFYGEFEPDYESENDNMYGDTNLITMGFTNFQKC